MTVYIYTEVQTVYIWQNAKPRSEENQPELLIMRLFIYTIQNPESITFRLRQEMPF
jgi:hypothetical protein